MLQLHDIRYSIGTRVLFEGVDWVIAPGDRHALIGPNGAGKTTLIRVALGELRPDSGTRVLSRGTRFGYLPQEAAERFTGTVLDRAMEAHRELLAMRGELEALHEELAGMGPDDPRLGVTLERAGELQHHLELRDEETLEPEARRVLAGLGFPESDLDRPLEEFSGGWRMRAALAALLLADPTVLFLDEPTNHLDLPAMEWLEEYLDGFRGGLVVVSHDRVFLDRVATSIRELDHELTDYPMSFTAYLEEKEKRRERIEAHNAQVDAKVAQLTRFVERFGAKNTKATQAQSKRKQIDRLLETRQVQLRRPKSIGFSFPDPPHAGRLLVTLKGVAVGYGGPDIVSGVDLAFERGGKVAIVGANGAGKTTLLKLLGGLLDPRTGDRRVFELTRMAYFAQHAAETLDPALTALEAVLDAAPDVGAPRARSVLGNFLFAGDDVEKPCGVLSGGERQRVALARMLVTPANLLLFDEPTHHLDLAGKEVLEEALEQFPGAVLVVTHDRSLMARLAEQVVEVEHGRAVLYPGGYDDYEERRMRRRAEAEEAARAAARAETRWTEGRGAGPAVPAGTSGASAAGPSAPGKRGRRTPDPAAAARKKAAQALAALERDIERVEARIVELEALLADTSIYADGARVKALVAEHRAFKEELESLWARMGE
jgi:ATP-binding cassette subfamily F protein 3